MMQKARRAAKAIVALAVPGSVLAVDLAGQFLGVTEDGTIVAGEWKLLTLTIVAPFLVWLKKNAPPAPPAPPVA